MVAIDLADADAAAATIRAIDDAVGGIDLLIANAGAGPDPAHDPHSWEAVRGPATVNFAGTLATLTAVLPRMEQRRRGHLVGISSLSSLGALPGAAAYAAPKAGLSMFLDCLRLDLRGTGVSVTTVYAGFVRTKMVEGATGPLPQLLDPSDAARRIWRRLPGRPARIDFPQPLAWLARLAGALPRPLHDALVRLVVGKAG